MPTDQAPEDLAAIAQLLGQAAAPPELTPKEIERLKRMAQADERMEWLTALLRRWVLAFGFVAAFLVALRQDLQDLAKWILAALSR